MAAATHFPHADDCHSSIEPMTDSDTSMNEPSMIGEGTSYTSTESQSQQPGDSPSIHDRLLSLASLAAKLDTSSQILPEHEEKLHWKLDKVEAELHALSRDAVPSDHSMPLEVATLTEPPKSTPQFAEGSTASLFRQVDQEYYKAVLGDLDSLTQEFKKRRDECLQIKSAAALRQDEFLKELSDREEKILSLRRIISENSTHMEALRGTVKGLEDWMRLPMHNWKRQGRWRKYSRRSPYHQGPSTHRRIATDIRSYDYDSGDDDDEINALFEGIEAWLRGWKDFEEEFRSRQQVTNDSLSII